MAKLFQGYEKCSQYRWRGIQQQVSPVNQESSRYPSRICLLWFYGFYSNVFGDKEDLPYGLSCLCDNKMSFQLGAECKLFFVLLLNLRQNRFSVWTVLVVREPQMSFELDVGYKLFSAFFTDKLFITYMLTDVASESFQLFVCLRAPLTPGEK